MKILAVGYALEKASGVTTFVERTAAELRALGHEVDVVDIVKGADRTEAVRDYDVVHLHCLWQLRRYAKAAFEANIPVVWSTHGMTAPWSMRHKWLKKKIAWRLFQKRELMKASAIHCTTQQEAAWNEKLGLRNCFVAPLGTDLAVGGSGSGRAVAVGGSGRAVAVGVAANGRRLLFVGRIHPVKGLENLIKAWKLAVGREGWKLRIVGPDEGGYLARLKSEVQSLSLEAGVEFAGPKFGDDLSREYENCDCLVLPSFTENFGAAAVDAMAHGKPVIASTFTPWREIADEKCGWWVSNEPEKLSAAVREMIEMTPDERSAMGERGRRLAEKRYSWRAVASELESIYKKVRILP